MCTQSMLYLHLGEKGFQMGHLNIQGIQNKIKQTDLPLFTIKLLWKRDLSESKLNDCHTTNFFNIKKLSNFS